MKKWLLLIFSLSVLASDLKADLGGCVVYHAKFYLKDGTIFNGCFEMAGYDAYLDENGSNEYCSDKGVFEVFKKVQRENGQVEVYKHLEYIRPNPLRVRSDYKWSDYGFCTVENLVYPDSASISKLIFWRAEYSNRFWLTSEIIIGPADMLDTLRNKTYWNSLTFSTYDSDKDTIVFQQNNFMDGSYGGYILYNYNAKINVAELKRLVHLKFPLNYEKITKDFKSKHKIKESYAMSPRQERLYAREIAKHWQSVRLWFWQKGIVIIEIWGTC